MEQSWRTQIGLLSEETKTEAVPQSDIHQVHSNQQPASNAEQSQSEVTQRPAGEYDVDTESLSSPVLLSDLLQEHYLLMWMFSQLAEIS